MDLNVPERTPCVVHYTGPELGAGMEAVVMKAWVIQPDLGREEPVAAKLFREGQGARVQNERNLLESLQGTPGIARLSQIPGLASTR